MVLGHCCHLPAKRHTNINYRCGNKNKKSTKLDENYMLLWGKKTFTFVTSLIINVFFSSSSGETVGGATGLRGFTGRSLQSQTNTSKLKLLKTSEDKIPGSHSKKMARKEGFFSKFCLRLLIGQSQHWGQEWDF